MYSNAFVCLLYAFRKWPPTPVFLPGKFHGQRSLVGYSPWGCKESGTTEATELTHAVNAVATKSHLDTEY